LSFSLRTAAIAVVALAIAAALWEPAGLAAAESAAESPVDSYLASLLGTSELPGDPDEYLASTIQTSEELQAAVKEWHHHRVFAEAKWGHISWHVASSSVHSLSFGSNGIGSLQSIAHEKCRKKRRAVIYSNIFSIVNYSRFPITPQVGRFTSDVNGVAFR
jgi:hypothetical protein